MSLSLALSQALDQLPLNFTFLKRLTCPPEGPQTVLRTLWDVLASDSTVGSAHKLGSLQTPGCAFFRERLDFWEPFWLIPFPLSLSTLLQRQFPATPAGVNISG